MFPSLSYSEEQGFANIPYLPADVQDEIILKDKVDNPSGYTHIDITKIDTNEFKIPAEYTTGGKVQYEFYKKEENFFLKCLRVGLVGLAGLIAVPVAWFSGKKEWQNAYINAASPCQIYKIDKAKLLKYSTASKTNEAATGIAVPAEKGPDVQLDAFETIQFINKQEGCTCKINIGDAKLAYKNSQPGDIVFSCDPRVKNLMLLTGDPKNPKEEHVQRTKNAILQAIESHRKKQSSTQPLETPKKELSNKELEEHINNQGAKLFKNLGEADEAYYGSGSKTACFYWDSQSLKLIVHQGGSELPLSTSLSRECTTIEVEKTAEGIRKALDIFKEKTESD